MTRMKKGESPVAIIQATLLTNATASVPKNKRPRKARVSPVASCLPSSRL